MEITFKHRKLKKIFALKGPELKRELYKKYGKENARQIMRVVAYLRDAASLAQVPHEKPFRRHMLSAEHEGKFAVDLKGQWRLLFEPNHDPLPRKAGRNELDLGRITAINILDVVDYH